MKRFFPVVWLFGVLMSFSPGLAQFMSTLQGGPWSAPSTWQAGRIPNAADDVVIIGPVQLDAGGDYFVHSLTVEAGGELRSFTSLPVSHMHVTQDVVNRGLVEGKSFLTPLEFTIGGGLINQGQWRTLEVFFPDTLQHLLRAEPGSFFSPSAIAADQATLISDRDMYLHGVEFRARKLILRLDHATFDTTTVFFLDGSRMKADVIVGQGNAIAGDTTSTIPRGTNTFVPTYWDVHIRGTTLVSTEIHFMNTLTIDDTLRSASGYSTMVVQGDLFNNGFVIPNDQNIRLDFDCFGNVINTGVFQVEQLVFMGMTTHFLGTSLTGLFNPKQIFDFQERVVSSSSIRLDGVFMKLQSLELQPGHELFTTQNSVLSLDTLIGNNNIVKTTDALRLDSHTYNDAVYQDVVFQGTILIDTHITLDGQTVNQGVLRAPDGSSGSKLIIQGHFVNQGELAPNDINSLLFVDLDADVDNQGDWQTEKIAYLNTGPYLLTMDTSHVFQAPSIQGLFTTVQSGSPLKFDGGSIRLHKMVLLPGHDLQLNQHVLLQVDTLEANGNRIRSDGAYTFSPTPYSQILIDSAILEDTSRFASPTSFAGLIVNEGVMQEASSTNWTLTFHGDFHNAGAVLPNSSNTLIKFVLEGNLENTGFWQSSTVDLKGTTLQKVAIPDSNNFQAPLNVWAMRSGGSYQWQKDGMSVANGGHLSGATTSILSFSRVASMDYGTYRCRIDSFGQIIFSRDVVIGDVITGIEPGDGGIPGISELPTRFLLEQNYPNPFNPTTTIRYQLPRAAHVSLTVYDALGRRVMELVNADQAPGVHSVQLDASRLASGIYFYRLKAGSFEQIRKMLLAK